jgi:hypothetical protein
LPLIFCNEKKNVPSTTCCLVFPPTIQFEGNSSSESTLDGVFGVLDIGGMYYTLLGELPSYIVGLNTFWRPP